MTASPSFVARALVFGLPVALAAAIAWAGDPVVQARALVGIEFDPLLPGDVVPGSECVSKGWQTVYINDRWIEGWALGSSICSERLVFTLEHRVDQDEREAKWRIVDSLLLPPPAKGARLFQQGDCELDGKTDRTLLAVVRLGRRERVDHRSGVIAAWSVDPAAGKIVPVSTKRVVCYRPTPP